MHRDLTGKTMSMTREEGSSGLREEMFEEGRDFREGQGDEFGSLKDFELFVFKEKLQVPWAFREKL